MKVYNKLVRDKIPDRIIAKGEECLFHVATEEEYREKLREKFLEEWNEYLASASSNNSGGSSDELADILEVIEALGILNGNTFEALLDRKRIRQEERGAFVKHIILEQS